MVVRPGNSPGRVDCDAPHLRGSRQPLLDGARALLRDGGSPGDTLEVARAATGPWDMRARVGLAARFTIEERDQGSKPPLFVKYRPPPQGRGEAQGRVKSRSRVSP